MYIFMEAKVSTHKKVTLTGMLVTLGVVYGDIGTSPLYVMKALIEGNGGIHNISESFVLGSVSLVFWTLTLLTSIKYVLIALRADNEGEGGIFSLFTLVKKQARWLIIPAMLGGAALLADGILTPAVTVTTAVEGLKGVPSINNLFELTQDKIIIIVIIIVSILFMIQRFGTEKIGKAFGPIMFGWFTVLGVLGFMSFMGNPGIIRALSPHYAIELLFSPMNKLGIFILGGVFLATTGAEALYSDMGHVGKQHIYATWPYVKICLLLNYLGQAAWITNNIGNDALAIEGMNPFFLMVDANLQLPLVILSTLAAIIASQSLITGSFTLVSEAIKLNMLPKLRIKYPSESKGQMYIPSVNNILWIMCIGVILYFRTSAHMEAAYGLAITMTMLMTTLLLFVYLQMKGYPQIISWSLLIFFGVLEGMFFISSVTKFFHGGFVAVIIALSLFSIMYVWTRGNLILKKARTTLDITDYMDQIQMLTDDKEFPFFISNLVYLTSNNSKSEVDYSALYSLLDKKPKRAKVYWFINIEVVDKPYHKSYTYDTFGTDNIIKVHLYLGFREHQHINRYLRTIIKELMKKGVIEKQPQEYTVQKGREVGDFHFIIFNEVLSKDSDLSSFERWIISMRLAIKKVTVNPERWFGLRYSDVEIENVPIAIGEREDELLDSE